MLLAEGRLDTDRHKYYPNEQEWHAKDGSWFSDIWYEARQDKYNVYITSDSMTVAILYEVRMKTITYIAYYGGKSYKFTVPLNISPEQYFQYSLMEDIWASEEILNITQQKVMEFHYQRIEYSLNTNEK